MGKKEFLLTDLLEVLTRIRNRYDKGTSINDLRLSAIKDYALREFEKGRFKTLDSSDRTIFDACTRRLGLKKILHFEYLVELWLSENSPKLEEVMITRIPDLDLTIHDFFTGEFSL